MKHQEKLDKGKIELSSFVSFLMGFSQAVLAYVMSSYFKLILGIDSQIGLFYTVSYVIFLLILFNLHKIIRLFGKSNVFYFSLVAKMICLTFLMLLDPSKFSLILLVLYIIFGSVEWVALDIIIESFSVDKMSGRIRGLHLTIMNLGYLFGPFVSVYILDHMNFQGIFTFSFIFNSFVLIFSLVGFRNVNHKFDQKLKVFDVIKKVMVRKNIIRIYYVSFVLDFFYVLMVIYMPLYLLELGFSWAEIGKIFTIMLIPFVILQYPIGVLADKKFGEKELITVSLILMGLATGMVFFTRTHNIILWGIVLLITRIGAAAIEILRDSYFYKRVDSRDVDIINFFRTSVPVASIAATIACSFVLYYLPISYLFLVGAVVVISALYPAFHLVDNKCEAELEKCKS